MPDLLVLELKPGSNEESIFIVNIYNIPARSKQAGKSAKILMSVSDIWQKCLLIMGDLNLYHTNWDDCTVHPISNTQRFAEWVTNNNGFHQLEPGVVTYAKGGTLDLVISSSLLSKQITESCVEPQFHVTSDHKTILT